jgi:hypothetical protein
MFQLQKNFNYSNINKEETNVFIPPIYYGKVIKIQSGDSFIITTPILFLNDKIENTPLYQFIIHLNGVSVQKIFTPMNIKSEFEENAKAALQQIILDRVVELRDIITYKYYHLYANVYIDNINVNEWLLQNNYVIKCKNGKIKRRSESDNYAHDKKNIPTNINLFIENLLNTKKDNYTLPLIENLLDTQKNNNYNLLDINKNNYNLLDIKKNNYNLPLIDLKETRPNSTCSSIILSDCFLSHNWGKNQHNHNLVAKINDELIKRGLKTWFDENKIEGNIRFKMAEGIDNTKCIVVFITKEYRDKVNGFDMKDNCKYEFTYSMNQYGSQYMIPVIMDPEMRDTRKWKGELGAALGSMLYVDLSDKNLSNTELDKKYDELYKKIKNIIRQRNKNV